MNVLIMELKNCDVFGNDEVHVPGHSVVKDDAYLHSFVLVCDVYALSGISCNVGRDDLQKLISTDHSWTSVTFMRQEVYLLINWI